jgi:hypothetical protein
MPRRLGLSFQTGIIPIYKAKIGVSAVKIKDQIFVLFIFNQLKITTALNLQSVRSQEINTIFSPLCSYQGKMPSLIKLIC